MRLAEAEFFDLYWSEKILAETRKNLIEDYGASEEQADKVISAMVAAFEGACVPAERIEKLIPAMPNDEKDRHVLAAAAAINAEQIVTFNLKHFPEDQIAPLGIEAIHPDDFLMNQLSLDAEVVLAVLERQAAAFRNPPWTLGELLGALELSVPKFVTAVQSGQSN